MSARHVLRRVVVLAAAVGLPLLGACDAPSAALPAPSTHAAAAPDTAFTLFLIGDAGANRGGAEPVLQALARAAAAAPQRTLIAFLGDNAYPHGLPPLGSPLRADAERRLNLQLDVVRRTGARALFLPGNHDWDHDAPDGGDAIRRQASYLTEKGGGRVQFLPAQGCPGPAVREAGSALRLVILDTQWWLREAAKPTGPDSACPADAPAEAAEQLRAAVAGARGRHVIVLAHHPLASGGPHGGDFDWHDHVFPLRELDARLWIPLPGIGSLYPLARRRGVSAQDLSSKANVRMRQLIERALAGAPLIYASGHEHSLQVIRGTAARYYLVSGSGTFDHTEPVEPIEGTLLAWRASGFMRLDVTADRRVRLAVIAVEGSGGARELFARWLTEASS